MEELTKQTGTEKYSEEYKPVILEESISDYWKDYNYWKTKEKLVIWREVKWNSWIEVKTWYSSIIAWNTNIVVWFKPKAIQVVVHSWNKCAWGYADDIWWTIWQRCIYSDSWSFSNQSSRLFRFSWTEVWSLASFNADWFSVWSDVGAIMIWTAFW